MVATRSSSIQKNITMWDSLSGCDHAIYMPVSVRICSNECSCLIEACSTVSTFLLPVPLYLPPPTLCWCLFAVLLPFGSQT